MSKSVKKTKKQEEHNILKNLVPYFRLSLGDLGGRVTCKLGGYAQPNDRIQDNIIESIDDEKSLKYGLYDVNYLTHHCNISGSYLVKNDKLPIYCKNVLYSKQFISGNLFSCFLYFTLDDQTKDLIQNKTRKVVINGEEKLIDDYSKYYNRLMSGKFTLELMTIDDDFLKKFLEYKKEKLESTIMIDYIDQFENSNEDEQEKIMLEISDKINVVLDVYKKYFEPIEIENPRKNKIVKMMDDMFDTEHMKEFIDFGLKFRDKKRIEESCPDQTFERPKKVINLKELKDYEGNLDEKIEEIINDYSDSEQSN